MNLIPKFRELIYRSLGCENFSSGKLAYTIVMAPGIVFAGVSDCGLMEKKKSQPDGLALVMEKVYTICG